MTETPFTWCVITDLANAPFSFIIFRDRNDRPGMRIGVSARMSDGGFRFRFNPDAILFRHPFTFNSDNEIFIDSKEKITGNV